MRLFPSKASKETPSVKVEVKPKVEPKPEPPKEAPVEKTEKPKVENTFEVSMAMLKSNGEVTKLPKLITDNPLDVINSNLKSLNYGFEKDEIASVTFSIDVVIKEVV